MDSLLYMKRAAWVAGYHLACYSSHRVTFTPHLTIDKLLILPVLTSSVALLKTMSHTWGETKFRKFLSRMALRKEYQHAAEFDRAGAWMVILVILLSVALLPVPFVGDLSSFNLVVPMLAMGAVWLVEEEYTIDSEGVWPLEEMYKLDSGIEKLPAEEMGECLEKEPLLTMASGDGSYRV